LARDQEQSVLLSVGSPIRERSRWTNFPSLIEQLTNCL
jgi:hypothetical protein